MTTRDGLTVRAMIDVGEIEWNTFVFYWSLFKTQKYLIVFVVWWDLEEFKKNLEKKIEIWNCLCLDHTPSVDANLGLFGRGTSNLPDVSPEVCLAWSCEDKRSKRTLSTSNT